MIQAFDVSVYNQLQKVNVERQKLINTERKIELLREEIDVDKKNKILNQLQIDRENILQTKNNLSVREKEEINNILNQYNVDNTVIQSLINNKKDKENRRQQLQELKSKAEQKIADIKTGFLGLGGGANRGALQDQIDNYRDEINSLTNNINALES